MSDQQPPRARRKKRSPPQQRATQRLDMALARIGAVVNLNDNWYAVAADKITGAELRKVMSDQLTEALSEAYAALRDIRDAI
jgi:hypothetical protein